MDTTINTTEARDLFVVFDGPPDHESGRFVELEDAAGKGVGGVAEWKYREEDELWTLGPFHAASVITLTNAEAVVVADALQRLTALTGGEMRRDLDWDAEDVAAWESALEKCKAAPRRESEAS